MDQVRIFLLGVIATLLAVIAFRPSTQEARADTGSSDGIIAVAAPQSSSLYLVNTKDKTIAHYENGSSNFKLKAARFYQYDLQIFDKSGKTLSVDDAKDQAEKDIKAGKFEK
jgi:hypothetical protein